MPQEVFNVAIFAGVSIGPDQPRDPDKAALLRHPGHA
jgi:hypothetical protein